VKKEKNTEKEINEVQEDQLEDVSGGGILSAHSAEDYIRALSRQKEKERSAIMAII